VTLVIVYALATRGGRTDMAALLLAGVAVSSFAGAIIALLYHFVEDGVLRQIVYWLMGNLGGKRWEHLAVLTPLVAAGCVGLWLVVPRSSTCSWAARTTPGPWACPWSAPSGW